MKVIDNEYTIDFISKSQDLVGFYIKENKVLILSNKYFSNTLTESEEESLIQEITAAGISGYAEPAVYKEKHDNMIMLRKHWPTPVTLPPLLRDKLEQYNLFSSLEEALTLKDVVADPKQLIDEVKKHITVINTNKLKIDVLKKLEPVASLFKKENKIVDEVTDDNLVISDKQTLLKLVREGNPDLLLRVVKTFDPNFNEKELSKLIDNPSKFVEQIILNAQKENINKNVLKNRYKKIVKAFNNHYNETLKVAARWQIDVFQFEVKIVSIYLAYMSLKKKIGLNAIINDLIKGLNPTDLRFVKQEEFVGSKVLLALATAGFIVMLVMFLKNRGE